MPGLVSPKICCDIQTTGSKFGINNMKLWILPALISKVQGDGGGTILGVFFVCVCGGGSFYTLGPLGQTDHCLNATAYLRIVTDCIF